MAIQLATAFVPIVPSVAGIQGQLASQVIAPAAKAGDQAGKGLGSRMRGHIVGALTGALAGGAALMGGAAVVDQFKKAISGAGDLEQSVGAIDSVFKNNAGVMHQWSRSAAKDVGLSRNEFNELGTLIGSQLKNGGTAMEDLAPKTNSLIGLGADLSSMFGGTTREAIEALSSALKGEMDPIEAYGVSLNQSKIDAEAAALGFEKVGGNLTDEGKQAAILSLIMKQTADAHGNFARESDTYAHKVQVFGAAWEDLRTKVGGLFLPVLTAVVGFLGDKLVPALTIVYGGIRAFGSAFSAAKDGMVDVTSTGFAGWMERVGNVVGTTYAAVRDALAPAFALVGSVLMATVVPALSAVAGFLWDHKAAIGAVVAVIAGFAAGWLGVMGAVRGAMLVVQGAGMAMAAMRGAIAAVRGAMLTARIAVMLFNSALLANPVGIVVGALIALGIGLVIAYNKVGWFKDAVDAVWAGIKIAAGAVAAWWTGTFVPAFQVAIEALGGFFTGLGTAAVGVWQGLQSAAGAVVTWWTGTLVPAFQVAIGVLGAAFNWLYLNIITPAMTGIKIIIAGVLAVVMTLFQGVVWLLRNTVGLAFTWLWQSVIVPVFNGITAAGAVFWAFLRDMVLAPIGNFIRGTLTAAWQWLQTTVANVWTGVKIIAAAGWAFVRDVVFFPLNNFIRGTVVAAWRWMQTTVANVWSGVRAIAAAGWAFVRDFVFQPIIGFIRGPVAAVWRWMQSTIALVWAAVRSASSAAWGFIRAVVFQPIINFMRGPLASGWRWLQSTIGAVWGAIRNVSSAAWGFIRGSVFQPIINFMHGPLASGWRWIRDTIGSVWGAIRNASSAAWGFIRDKVFNPLKSAIMDSVPAAFRKGRDAIQKAWDALEGVAKKPVKFVVQTVINDGLIGNFNKIADKIGIGKLPTVALPKGFARGGWTGPGSKFKPAGVVHADEYVVKKSSRRDVESKAPGLLDRINGHGYQGLRSYLGNGYAEGGWVWPVAAQYPVTQHPNAGHMAYDIGTPVGTRVNAAAEGRVAHAGPGARVGGVWGGNEIHLDHGSGLYTWYAHLSRILVKTGQIVKKGSQIALSGNTGVSQGPHLHFESIRGGEYNLGAGRGSFDPRQSGLVATGAYSEDGGGGGIMSWLFDKFVTPIKNWISGAVNKTRDAAPGAGMWVDLASGVGKKLGEGVRDFVTDKINIFGGGNESGGGGGAEQWRGTITDALKRTGLPTSNDFVEAWLRQVQSESGGNPRAKQGIIDVNSGGNEAAGLLQVTKSTFAAYRDPSLPDDRFNPLSSAVAGMRWAKAKYGIAGMLGVIGHGHGYADGGRVLDSQLFDGGGVLHKKAGPQLIEHRSKRPDYVLPEKLFTDMHSAAQAAAQHGDGEGGVYVGNVYGQTAEELAEEIIIKQRRARKLARR